MDASDMSEGSLWRRSLHGNADAFALIFDLHRDRVFRHSYRLLQSRDDAEDASAIAFLELWRHRMRVRLVDGSVLAWLIVTATNTSRNLARSKRRYHALLEALPHGEHEQSAEDHALQQLHADQELAGALTVLSAVDAGLLSLVALEGYSVTDAASMLGISPGAARTRLHRTRAVLQKHLGHTTLAGYLAQEAT